MSWYKINSSKDKKHLVVDGYIHRIDKRCGNNEYFKCIDNCGGRAILKSETTCIISKSHNHPNHGAELAKRGFRETLKEKVVSNPTMSVPQSFHEVRRSLVSSGIKGCSTPEVEDAVPMYTSVRSSAYRKRMKLVPKLPNKLSELFLEDEWRSTNDGKDFLLGCDGLDDKIVIFGTEGFLRRLCSSDIVFMDGTFKSAPHLFTQIYTLHSYVEGIMIPLVYALLPNKSTATYSRMFKIIKEAAVRHILEFRPKTFQIDFEIGMIVSIRETFGYETSIKGCLFHFGQAIWRKVQNLGLIHDYQDNDDIKKTVRRVCSLALVPNDQIDNCWEEIHAQAPQHEGLDKLMSYFVETYLDSDVCIFNRSMWNHYETNNTRTINHLEGWHAALNRTIGRPHPNIFILIRELKNQQQNFELDILSQKKK